MTTARSPLPALKAQARQVAAWLKAAERGEDIPRDPGGKIAAARARPCITFAVVMDDKILQIEMTWEAIRNRSEADIAKYILDRMREERATYH